MVALESYKLVVETIAVPQTGYARAEASLDLTHELRVRHLGMNTNCDQVISDTVEYLDLDKGNLRIACRHGGCIQISSGRGM